MIQVSAYANSTKKVVGEGRFSCAYVELDGDNTYFIKKIICPKYEFEKKLLGDCNELPKRITHYCNCLNKLGVDFAKVIQIEKESNQMIMTQEYIEGILLKDYIKKCKNLSELAKCFQTIINWVILLKQHNENYRIDLNLSNFIIHKSKKNAKTMDIVLIDLCPVFDARNKITLDNLFEKTLFRMKMDISASIEMMITYTMKNLIEDISKVNTQQEIEEFYQCLLKELEKNQLMVEIRNQINNISRSPEDSLIPNVRMWAIDQYMNHCIKKEEVDVLFSISSITKLRKLKEKEQETYIKNIKKEVNRRFNEDGK